MRLKAGLEPHGPARGDVDAGAGAWVAADAGLAGLHGEDAEAPELDAIAFGQGTLHGAEDGVDGGFGLVALQTCALGNTLDEILLDQAGTPFTSVEGL